MFCWKSAEPERQAVGDDVDLVAAARELLAELGRHRARAAHRRIADDADPHSDTTWCPRANGVEPLARASGTIARPCRATSADEAEPALLQRAARQQRVARAAQPLGAALVALLERAQRLLVQALDLVQRAPAAPRPRPRAASGRARPSASSTRAQLALDRLARPGEGRLDVGVVLARPARHEPPRGRPRGRRASAPRPRARAPAAARRASRSAAAASTGRGMPKCA